MAYAAVASLSHTIHLILNHHEDSVTTQFKDQIISLHKHIIFLESFLEDFPDRAYNWEETIREVSDRAEDIIELLLSDSLLQGSSSKSKFKKGDNEVHYSFDELERVADEMESITNRVKGVRRTEYIVGSDDECVKIFAQLATGSSALEIIPIVGVGGIGKTSLASYVYHHPFTIEQFDIRSWSTVTNYHSLPEIIADIMHSPYSTSLSNSEDRLIQSLYNSLRGRRFLLVLDDVRNFEVLSWLQKKLPDDGNGSRIIITTRSFELARSAGCIHEVSLMDGDKTWDLFREKIFKGDPCPSQLESLGKEIARSCRGHRLSIQVVSGILAADQNEATWEDVSENLKLASEDGEGDLPFHILSQCYRYLPHHLRPCFLYLGMFPKNHNILVSKLIKLWIGEGFLNESESKSFEETGESFVEDLVRRSLVSGCTWKTSGRIKNIKIHDLVRDLCIRQAQIDNFIHHAEISHKFPMARELRSCRRVSDIIYDDDFLEGVYGSTIRTIMLNYGSALGVKFLIGNVKLLRILDSSNAYYYDLPEEVFELFHLRYLAFNCGFSIPEALSNLENLQTLIIRSREIVFEKFGELPKGIWRMPQLRHLIVFHFKLPNPKGVTTSALENLQTLSGVVDFICSRENLKMIPNLKKLAIFYSVNSGDVVENYQLDNLIYLKKLEILKIEMVMHGSFVEEHKMSTRCAFQFPPTLKKLILCGLQLPWEDLKVVASLPNLQLHNHACIGKRWETSDGGFSQLRYLMIVESNLVNWIAESSHFPRLECLVLDRCLSLFEVPNDMGNIPTLTFILLDRKTSHYLLSSVYKIQEDLQSSGVDRLRIRFL